MGFLLVLEVVAVCNRNEKPEKATAFRIVKDLIVFWSSGSSPVPRDFTFLLQSFIQYPFKWQLD